MLEDAGRAPDGAVDVDMLDAENRSVETAAGDADEEDDWDDGVQWKGETVEIEEPSEDGRSRGVGAGGAIKETKCTLTSIQELRAQVASKKHSGEPSLALVSVMPR
jgi:hypothetical protein